MKKILKTGSLALVIAVLFSNCVTPNYTTLSTVTPQVSFQTFYDDLSPYGTWMDYPGYGQVWHPGLNEDFRPYASNGYWVYSNEGWAWQSDYNWGWAPFHYGRWTYDDMYGWLWVPGYEWSPAWVTWGNVDDYYAWAPLQPEVNISLQFGSWRPNNFYWNVCPHNNIYDRDLYRRIERPDRIRDFGNRVNIINNFNTTRRYKQYYSRGPEVVEVEKYSNRKVEQVGLVTVRKVNTTPQNGNVREVFRPTAVPNPQPKEYRRVETNQTNLIRIQEQKPTRPREEQNKNIEKLPVYKPTPVPQTKPVENKPAESKVGLLKVKKG